MTSPSLKAMFAAALLVAATGEAAAAPFALNPAAAGLNGAAFTADTMALGDFAAIRFGADGLSFADAGVMPILGFSLDGRAVDAPGFLAPGGAGWGAYIRYGGSGTQALSPQG